jgi:hypothetical protein
MSITTFRVYVVHPKRSIVEIAVSLTRLVQIASVITVSAFVSAAAMPALADNGNCGNGRGAGQAVCKSGTATGSVAPLPALGTGLPGLIVLAGGLVAFARRRR